MESEKRKFESVYSKKVRAGRRRTYFFDVRTTRSNDYYITVTESKRKFDEDGYERHKLFLYKEDFNKFVEGLSDTVNHIKSELLPDYDFDQFDRPIEDGTPYDGDAQQSKPSEVVEHAEVKNEAESVEADAVENVDEAPAPEAAEEPVNDDDLKWD